MLQETEVVDLIGKIYDAALEPERWRQVLQDLTAAFGAAASGIHVRSFRRPHVVKESGWVRRTGCSWFASSSLDPAYEKAYGEHYFAKDPWAACVPHQLTPGVFSAGQQLVPQRELLRTEFYNDLCQPFGFADWIGGIALYEPGQCWIAVGMLGHRGDAAFDTEHLAGLQLLMPHLRRALEVSRRMLELDREAELVVDTLDRAPFGVIFVDEAARVIRTNRAAERILSQCDGLAIEAKVLVTVDPRARGELSAAIGRTLQGTLPNLLGPNLVQAPRPHPARPLALFVAPVRPNNGGLAESHARCVVHVIDPDHAVDPPEDVLRRLFSLTAAEARLALLVGQGLVPKEAAAKLGISWNTARFQLRQVFAKTRTDRQASLVRLLASFGSVASFGSLIAR